MKHIKKFEELESYEKKFDGFEEKSFYIVKDINTLLDMALHFKGDNMIRKRLFEIIGNIKKDYKGIIIYVEDPMFDVSGITYYDENDMIDRFSTEYKFQGELKMKDRVEIILDTLKVDTDKYNL